MSESCWTNLIESLGSAHDPRPLDPRHPQCFSKDRSQRPRMHSDNHRLGSRGVDQRSESIEHGRERDRPPHGRDADHGRVVIWCVEEEEGGGLGDEGDGGGGEGGDGAIEGEEDVGGARGRGGGFVAVLSRTISLSS